MVGPLGDAVELVVSPPVRLVSEVDGVRVLSDERHELLRRVPEPLAEVFRVGSTAPGERFRNQTGMKRCRRVRSTAPGEAASAAQ